MSREKARMTCLVRFIGVSKAESDRLKRSIEVSHSSLRPYTHKEGTYCLTFALTENVDGKLVANSFKSIDDAILDVFISVRTEYDSEIVDIPRYVTEFIGDSGAEIVFSFTVG